MLDLIEVLEDGLNQVRIYDKSLSLDFLAFLCLIFFLGK